MGSWMELGRNPSGGTLSWLNVAFLIERAKLICEESQIFFSSAAWEEVINEVCMFNYKLWQEKKFLVNTEGSFSLTFISYYFNDLLNNPNLFLSSVYLK